MKICLISSRVYGYDGGLSELVDVCEKIGDVDLVAYTKSRYTPEYVHGVYVRDKSQIMSPVSQLKFIVLVCSVFKSRKPVDMLFVDDFLSALAGYLAYRLMRPKYTVMLSRELYYGYKMPGLGNVFLRFERAMYRVADVILCRNKERAAVMTEKYVLKVNPYVYENVRRLNGEYNEVELDEKYRGVFKGKINIISTGGCSLARGTDRLIAAVAKNPQYELCIFGEGPQKDYVAIQKMIEEKGIHNVFLFKRVSVGELRYAIHRSDIGIIEYHKNNLNNIYCASGKLYEYMFEGLPVVTTENESLKALCAEYHVGVADDGFFEGINTVANNLEQYRENVRVFISGVSEQENNRKLCEFLLSEYRRKWA